MKKRVLLVEDDTVLRPVLSRMIEKINPEVRIDSVASAEDALDLIRGHFKPGRPGGKDYYDLILADIFLEGDRTGLDLFNACRQAELSAPIVLTSGRRFHKVPALFLPKPITFAALQKTVAASLVPQGPEREPLLTWFFDTLFWSFVGFWLVMVVLILATPKVGN